MARILLVHGINNERLGPRTGKRAWLSPLLDGMEFAGGKGCPLPSEDDVDVAFWGDLFRPKGHVLLSAEPPPLEPQDLTEPGEQALLAALLQAAERTVSVPPAREGSLMAAPSWLQAAVYKLAGSTFFRGIYGPGANTERWLLFGLKTVHRYMHDSATYEAVQRRVDDIVGDDTRVIIGHSLGSVIAYEALCRAPRRVDTLITLASPLGVPTLIYDRLRPAGGWSPNLASSAGRVRVSPKIAHWFNAWDAGDLIALVKPLAPFFEPGLRDIQISTGTSQPHAFENYLTDAEVGRAVAQGWR